jgi:signal transduction histidine kinase
MDDSEVDKIFNEFYRIEDFSTRQTEGCGLGLSIVRNYVNFLGGSISVESKPGLGSEFTVKIPRVLSSKSNPSKIVEATQVYISFKIHR